jgi:hypothetical protein
MKALALFILMLLLQFPALAQEEIAVARVIGSLFEGMKAKDPALLENAFHPEAMMHTVIAGETGATLGSNTVRDFINRIAATPTNTILGERILDYNIKIDGDMASAWTAYEFYVNEGFSHCGVNSFQLIRTSEGWKITYVIDTRRKTGCK